MPTYEYECSKCGSVFEAFQGMTEPPLNKCKKCGAKGTVSRLIGAGAGLIFKGSGFYETDYKRSSASTTSSGGNGKDKTETESKPDKPEQKEKPKTPSSKSTSATPSKRS